MNLFILRHGEADSRASMDMHRSLTERGMMQTHAVVELRKDALSKVSQLFVSPFLRANQTANEIESTLLGKTPGFGPLEAEERHELPWVRQEVEWLTPDTQPQKVIYELDALGLSDKDEDVLLVSHQPLVSSLIAWIKDGNLLDTVGMGTSYLACLSCEIIARGCGELKWLQQT